MGEIVKLNNYDIKDKTARANHSALVKEVNNFVDDVNAALGELESKIGQAGSGSYLPLSGGTITGDVTLQATSNADSANFTWGTVNSNTPYFGYASDQTDGTFVWSLKGTNYASGLAIGGGSGNLLWKGTKVATTSDIPSVSVTQKLTSGTEIGSVKVGSTTTKLYAPTASSVDLSNYSTLANTIKSLSISGTTITYTKGDGTTGTLTTQDNAVAQTFANNTTLRPLLMSAYYGKANSSGSANKGTVWTNLIFANPAHGTLTATAFYEGSTLLQNKYAPIKSGLYYVEDNGSTTAGTWLGTCDNITELYDGLAITYKVTVAGASTTTLNINDLGAKTVYMRGTSKVTTHYAVGTMLQLTYNATTDAWYTADYDANSYAYMRQYYTLTTSNAEYPIIYSYTTNTGTSSYKTAYGAVKSGFTFNPSTDTLTLGSWAINGSSGTIGVDDSTYLTMAEGIAGLVSGTLVLKGVNGVSIVSAATSISGDASIAGALSLNTLKIPTSSGGTTLGAGTSGQVLKTNGTTVYWGTDNTGLSTNYVPTMFKYTLGVTLLRSGTAVTLPLALLLFSGVRNTVQTLTGLATYLYNKGFKVSSGMFYGLPCDGAVVASTNNYTKYSIKQIAAYSTSVVWVEVLTDGGDTEIGEVISLNYNGYANM